MTISTAIAHASERCWRNLFLGLVLAAGFPVQLLACDGMPALVNGVPVTGISGDEGDWCDFAFRVPEGDLRMRVVVSGGTGDADLYVRHNEFPFPNYFDCAPLLLGNDEECDFGLPKGGDWFISLRGYSSFANVSLVVQAFGVQSGTTTALANGTPVTGIGVSAGQWQWFHLDVPADQTLLQLRIHGGTGDADLYTRYVALPSQDWFVCRPYLDGNAEACRIFRPMAGRWYVGVYGYLDTAGIALDARFTSDALLLDGFEWKTATGPIVGNLTPPAEHSSTSAAPVRLLPGRDNTLR